MLPKHMREYREQLVTPDMTAPRPAPRPAVGLIVLSTDMTSERDFSRMSHNSGVEIDWYVNRIRFANPITVDNLCAMLADLESAAADILPDCPLGAVVFNCTAGSALLGDDAIAEVIHASKREAKVITTASAAAQEMLLRGCRSINVLTPYNASVSHGLADYFEARGLQVRTLAFMDLDDDRKVASVPREAIMDAAVAALDPYSDALFISCTALRSAELLADLEKALGKPVFSSNDSVFRHTLRTLRSGRGAG